MRLLGAPAGGAATETPAAGPPSGPARGSAPGPAPRSSASPAPRPLRPWPRGVLPAQGSLSPAAGSSPVSDSAFLEHLPGRGLGGWAERCAERWPRAGGTVTLSRALRVLWAGWRTERTFCVSLLMGISFVVVSQPSTPTVGGRQY